ncbi:MAG: PIN domain-containing protein [Nanoarchaeota archaeon]
MKLVIDANILFSAIIAKGGELNSKKIDLIFSKELEIFSPELLLFELRNNKEKIKDISGLPDEEFKKFVEILKSRIKFVSLKYFSDKISEAKELCKQLKDVAYFALALKLNCPIWSGEKSFKEQSKLKVFNTKELLEELFESE